MKSQLLLTIALLTMGTIALGCGCGCNEHKCCPKKECTEKKCCHRCHSCCKREKCHRCHSCHRCHTCCKKEVKAEKPAPMVAEKVEMVEEEME